MALRSSVMFSGSFRNFIRTVYRAPVPVLNCAFARFPSFGPIFSVLVTGGGLGDLAFCVLLGGKMPEQDFTEIGRLHVLCRGR